MTPSVPESPSPLTRVEKKVLVLGSTIDLSISQTQLIIVLFVVGC